MAVGLRTDGLGSTRVIDSAGCPKRLRAKSRDHAAGASHIECGAIGDFEGFARVARVGEATVVESATLHAYIAGDIGRAQCRT